VRGWPVAVATMTLTAVHAGANAMAGELNEQTLRRQYVLHCSGCHGPNGEGLPEKGIPNFKETGLLVSDPKGRAYLVRVPGVAQSPIDDAGTADLLNWILREYGKSSSGNFAPFTPAEVARYRANPENDPRRLRQNLLRNRSLTARPQTRVPATSSGD